jgi:hypothetical protein
MLRVVLSTRSPEEQRKVEDRRQCASALVNWAESANMLLEPEFRHAIEDGFPDGDDAFDAAVGLFGMLGVLLKRRESGEPQEDSIRKLEDWILGQSC